MFLRVSRENENKFVGVCLEKYEELMAEEQFFSSKTEADMYDCHSKVTEKLLVQLPDIWKGINRNAPVSARIKTTVTERMERSFDLLKRHALQSIESAEKIARVKERALQHYQSQMEEYLENSRNISLSGLKDMHTSESTAAIKIAKDSEGVRAATVDELKYQVNAMYETYVSRVKMAESEKDISIGIDLGTTRCCVMAYINEKVEVIPNRVQGNKNTTPSYVCYHEDGSDTFGDVAKEEAFRYPETTIFDMKRMIGRNWSDPVLQNDRKVWPFEVVNKNGHPKVEAWGRTRYPLEISARLLAQFRFMADEHFGLSFGSVSKAVITVPAYFTETQRRATAEAAECAGLDVLNILSEPTAAAIAYTFGQKEIVGKRNVLIYDLGGGTFDVAVATIKSGQVDILAVGGDTHLGGHDFDKLLMHHCIEEFKKKEGVDLLEGLNSPSVTTGTATRRALTRLKLQCEKAKEWLSSSKKKTINVDCIHQGKNLIVEVTQKKLEEIIRPLVLQTIVITARVLTEVSSKGIADPASIDDIILVGGSTRIPLVTTMLKEIFKGIPIHKGINPDEAVAYGAAIQASVLKNIEPIFPFKIQDVTPMTIGILQPGDRFCGIIPKYSKIPCSISTAGGTGRDNQTSFIFTLYQGENDKAAKNEELGKFTLGGLPPRPAGEERARMAMTIDRNGILHVSAVSDTTGNSSEITASSDRLVMDDEVKNKLKKEVYDLARAHVVDNSDSE